MGGTIGEGTLWNHKRDLTFEMEFGDHNYDLFLSENFHHFSVCVLTGNALLCTLFRGRWRG